MTDVMEEPIDRFDREVDYNVANIDARRVQLSRIYHRNLVERRERRGLEEEKEEKKNRFVKEEGSSGKDSTHKNTRDTRMTSVSPTAERDDEASAANIVLSTPELLEVILIHLDPLDLLLRCQRVNHTFHNLITTSPSLTRKLFLRAHAPIPGTNQPHMFFPFSIRPSPVTHLMLLPPTPSPSQITTLTCGYALATDLSSPVRKGLGRFLTQFPARREREGVVLHVRVQIYGDEGVEGREMHDEGPYLRTFRRVVEVRRSGDGRGCDRDYAVVGYGSEGLRFADVFHEITRAISLLELKRGMFVRRGAQVMVWISPDTSMDEEGYRKRFELDKARFRRTIGVAGEEERRRVLRRRRGSF